jgi:NADPH-dependent curcumin reductase CurA
LLQGSELIGNYAGYAKIKWTNAQLKNAQTVRGKMDEFVYALFALTPDEIKIVEGATK